jgi:hypothetical protein
MEICACDIRVGDYIHGVGVVTNVRDFCSEIASGRVPVKVSDSDNYEVRVKAEMQRNYDKVCDRVVVSFSGGERTFFNDTRVNVMRFGKQQEVKEAA